jgi:adenylate cyclase
MNARDSFMRRDHRIVDWLLRDGRRITDSTSFLGAFADQLLADGIAIARIVTGVPILHPQVFSFAGSWQAGKGTSERRNLADAGTFSRLRHSPIKTVYDGGGPVRLDLTAPAREGEYPICSDLRRENFTDYFAIGIPFSDGSNKALALATKRPGGFTTEEIEVFEAMVPAVAVNLEIQALRRTAETLLEVYVGRQAGKRVLSGAIKRGMGETIPAVIWLCDLRGFSTLSETLPRATTIDLLNAYFGAMCQAIEQHEGEVLKFMGDAVLAIFPISEPDASPACRRALAAARAAASAIALLNADRLAGNEPAIQYGTALHVGDVIYGNIGGEHRLDFTVIGPAVNLAVRIEGLCRELGHSLLLSEAFVSAAKVAVKPVGRFALKGIAAPQTLSAPSQ